MTEPSPTAQAVDAICQPYDRDGQWTIRLHIAHLGGFGPLQYGHSFVQVLSPDQRSVVEFHGYNRDPVTGEPKASAGDPGDKLSVVVLPGAWDGFSNVRSAGGKDWVSGSYEEIKPHLARLFAASETINGQELPYKGWGLLQTGQNCNSVTSTMGRLLGHTEDPQKASSLILTGSTRILPLEALDRIIGAGGLDMGQFQQGLSDTARISGQTITMPDLDSLISTPRAAQCHAAGVPSIAATAYEPDGSKREAHFRTGFNIKQP